MQWFAQLPFLAKQFLSFKVWTLVLPSVASAFLYDIDNNGRKDIWVAGQQGLDVLVQGSQAGFSFDRRLHLNGKFSSTGFTLAGLNQAAPILCFAEGNDLTLVTFQPATSADYVNLRLKGISDDNGGGRVNEYAIGSTLELFSTAGYQATYLQDSFVHFGLGTNGKPYSLRIIFPNGLTQTIVEPKKNQLIEEKQELKGSCPFVYGWDGSVGN